MPAPTELYGSDAYAPSEVAQRIETVGVNKARLTYHVIYGRAPRA